MNVKICKKLKEKGFPQEKFDSFYECWGYVKMKNYDKEKGITKKLCRIKSFEEGKEIPKVCEYKLPSIPELLFRLKDDFKILERKGYQNWIAKSKNLNVKANFPDEALADLWLVYNATNGQSYGGGMM